MSLHRLLETAPLPALASFLSTVEDGEHATIFDVLPWDAATDEALKSSFREHLIGITNKLPADAAAPLDRHAQRVLTLAEARGTETINRLADKLSDPVHVDDFRAQLDAIGRSLWMYQHQVDLFDEAECLFYADHYRNFGRMYEAFEIDAEKGMAFVWDDSVKHALETQIQTRLELTGRCTLTHLEVTGKDKDGHKQLQHLVIVRHGGPLSSVAFFEESDGSRGDRYYRPLNEATLLFTPADGVIEVFSSSPSVRQQVAACFADTGLKIDLSDKPLTLKQYNFARFLTSLNLSIPIVHGFDIDRVAVVDIDVRPDNPKHRAGLKVTIDDDVEVVAQELFGQDHLFKRASSIARIVIAVRYTQHETDRTKTLNITLSEPNRCNLRSNRDPVQRDLGYELLASWGILHNVKSMTRTDVHSLFPVLLQLYDQATKEVPGLFFLTRKLDPQALLDCGFIERRGRYVSLHLDENGVTHEVAVRSAGRPGVICYAHPVDGRRVELSAEVVDKYSIRRDWLDEIIHKRLKDHLLTVTLTKLDDHLIYLGEMQLGSEIAPCYLARDLRTPSTLQRLDILMRAKSDRGIGIVLSAGRDGPLYLGPNVVAAIADYLADDSSKSLLDVDRIASAFSHGKQMARGGMVVELVKKDSYSATLYIPGKPPLSLAGPKAIGFFQALIDAYRLGSPPVPTKQLMSAAGSASASPSQLFPKKFWASIEGVYVGCPPGVARGHFQLLV